MLWCIIANYTKALPGVLPCLWNPKALLKRLDDGFFPICFPQPCKWVATESRELPSRRRERER